MITSTEVLLVTAVAGVGILHTMVPDHWVPITLFARQQGWTKGEVARAALVSGTGHTVSTLLIGLIVWFAGVAFATKFGNLVSTVSSIALIAFGAWIAVSSIRSLRSGAGHGHSHGNGHAHIVSDHDAIELSIFETGTPPHFRLSGHSGDGVWVETLRPEGARQRFAFVDRGAYWESIDEVPEPHEFLATVSLTHGDRVSIFTTTALTRGIGEMQQSQRSHHFTNTGISVRFHRRC
jgi:ABC-type nickel/cobalt efflux system permease component RcnA